MDQLIYKVRPQFVLRHSSFVILLLVLSCSRKENTVPDVPVANEKAVDVLTLSDEQYKTVGIELGRVEERVLTGMVTLTGMLDVPPQNMVNITAPFGGFLRSTALLQGMHVSRGQTIAVIENPEYIQLQQDFLDTKSQTEFLEKEFQRQEELSKENVNSQKTLQKSRADLTSMKAKNNGLRAKLKMLDINPDLLGAGAIRSTIEIHSPINGYVTQIHSSVGSFVSPTDVMFKIVDTDHLHAELTAFERDIPKIKIGQTIRFTLANETVERFAKVFLIGKEISSDRTVRIHGHIDKEDRDLIPGMFLKARIETGGQKLSSLPEDAVVNSDDKNFIFIKDPSENRYTLTEVTTGIREGGYVEVNFAENKRMLETPVVIKGAYKLLSKLKNSELGEEPGH